MRCYLMRDGHIQAVEFLTASDDAGRIAEAMRAFEAGRKRVQADGFEVWDGGRFVYRFPDPATQAANHK
jgi:hypothetical protein